MTSNLGKILGTSGLVGAAIYGVTTNKTAGKIILYAAIFGISGFFIGNAVTKFYE